MKPQALTTKTLFVFPKSFVKGRGRWREGRSFPLPPMPLFKPQISKSKHAQETEAQKRNMREQTCSVDLRTKTINQSSGTRSRGPSHRTGDVALRAAPRIEKHSNTCETHKANYLQNLRNLCDACMGRACCETIPHNRPQEKYFNGSAQVQELKTK